MPKATPPPPPPPSARFPIPREVAENEDAKREFVRAAALMEGRLDMRDLSLLADYALTHAEIVELRNSVAIEGRVFEGPKGGSYLNPTVNLLMSRQNHLAQLRRDLYFTPKSRIEKQSKAVLSKARSIRDSVAKDDGDDGDDD